MKNVLKIEKNEELNYEFDKQNPTSTKLVGFFVCALRHFILPAIPLPGRQDEVPGRGMAGSVFPGETHYIYKEKFIKR